ncbi:hypothetical protein [Halorussus pelagicus]|uniref:hypothetical protein n=1 Tax=Halorussus pelagicus TaxID=2505977 RepID=UPI000FFB6503|nr:hypothetical protein [Halorussus pelagicus]
MTSTDEMEALIKPAYWSGVAGFVAFGAMSWTSFHGFPVASQFCSALFLGCYLGAVLYLMVVSELSSSSARGETV